jgi:hypothetical protein
MTLDIPGAPNSTVRWIHSNLPDDLEYKTKLC